MKKVFSLLLVTAAVLVFAASCGGGSGIGKSGGPADIEKSIYTQFQKGNYQKGVEIMLANIDSEKEISEKEMAEFLTGFTGKVSKSMDELGGLKSFEIISEEIAEDGLTAQVTTKTIFGNGEEKEETTKYVNKDGKWKMSLGK